MRKATSFFLWLGLTARAFGIPCGGEGPQPFLNLTGSVTFQVRRLPTVGSPKEFIHWEERGALVYRNEWNQVRVAEATGNDFMLDRTDHKLSRLVDETESFILTEGESWFLNLSLPHQWIHFWKGSAEPTKLFWDKDRLYLLNTRSQIFGGERLEVHSYVANNKTSSLECSYSVPAKAEFKLARGHSFPYVYLYDQNKQSALTLYQFDVTQCQLMALGSATEPLSGPVQDVVRFERFGAFAVKMDNPGKDLRWETEDGCAYYDIGSENLFVPNYESPFVVTSSNSGTHFYNLNTATIAKFRGGFEGVAESDLWLSRKTGKLMMAPSMGCAKQLFSVDVEDMVGSLH